MIAVDTSALMAVILGEPESDRCIDLMAAADELVISAGTVAEALIVAHHRNVGAEMAALLDELYFTITPVTAADARSVAAAHARWGKGVHHAALNFGDCFAYVAAASSQCPLLFVGDDFSRTDVAHAA